MSLINFFKYGVIGGVVGAVGTAAVAAAIFGTRDYNPPLVFGGFVGGLSAVMSALYGGIFVRDIATSSEKGSRSSRFPVAACVIPIIAFALYASFELYIFTHSPHR